MEELFLLDNVCIISKKKRIMNLNIKVNVGDFLVIKGSNATGKSLLLKLFYLKVLPSSGTLYVGGKKISSESKKNIIELRRRMGVILQNDYLIPFFSVFQNIELASQIQQSRQSFMERMSQISSWLELDKIKDEKINSLSNSQKQKVVIARALINNPRIILADQPETYLDENSNKKFFFLLESLSKLGTTIIMTSNNKKTISIDYRTLELQ
ncbi:MAG: ATP-binding cassette domain-containing protein [Alphaproteobacteria bacterium]